jgi:CubicO group peptidase (beta-lactamase class C family)
VPTDSGIPFAFAPVLPQQAGFAAPVLNELDQHLEALVASGQVPGHALLLARGDQIVHAHVTGYADWLTKRRLAADDIFPLYSMSKPLAAIAMLLLHEEGRWQLDDPVALHLPEFEGVESLPGSRATRGPTIRETFTHTAGFSLGKTVEEMTATVAKIDWSEVGSLRDLVARYATIPLGYEPGMSWEYSIATDLQAAMVERLSGERYDVFLRRRVFDPLGMGDTRFVLDYDQTRRLVRSHVLDHETGRLRGAMPAEQRLSIFPMGGTSFHSTLGDFARLARMLLGRGQLGDVVVLKPESVDLMLSNHLSDAFLETPHQVLHYMIGGGNGHGLNGLVCLDPERAGRTVGRGTYEWGGAFGTWFWIDPEHQILCIGMSNRARIATDTQPVDIVAQRLVYRALREGAGPVAEGAVS